MVSMYVSASDSERTITSGSIDISVNAANKEGFACASGAAKSYLLESMPKFISSLLGTAGLLRAENNGTYRVALVIDAQSKLQGYKVGPETLEDSKVVQALIGVKEFPPLPQDAVCVADKVFLYKLTLSQ